MANRQTREEAGLTKGQGPQAVTLAAICVQCVSASQPPLPTPQRCTGEQSRVELAKKPGGQAPHATNQPLAKRESRTGRQVRFALQPPLRVRHGECAKQPAVPLPE